MPVINKIVLFGGGKISSMLFAGTGFPKVFHSFFRHICN